MGEIADMMLDGTCCASCGEFMGDGDGFAVYCEECSEDSEPFDSNDAKGFFGDAPKPKILRVNCPYCKKRVKEIGIQNHIRDVHPNIETNLIIKHR